MVFNSAYNISSPKQSTGGGGYEEIESINSSTVVLARGATGTSARHHGAPADAQNGLSMI